jgi:ABC-type phosphate transport system substrate-binding protein
MLRISLIIICLATLAAAPSFAAGELVIIVNKENSNAIDRPMISKIYLGNMARWPAGGSIVVIELPEDQPETAIFSSKVIGKSVQAIKAIWAQNVFTGRVTPPKIAPNDEEVKRIVANSKNGIGYIKASSVDSSVKVILTVH